MLTASVRTPREVIALPLEEIPVEYISSRSEGISKEIESRLVAALESMQTDSEELVIRVHKGKLVWATILS